MLTDWSSTFTEVNNLRSGVQHKGENYVGILGKPSEAALRAHDAAELDRLTVGLWSDDDAAIVRFYDADAKLVYEHVRPSYEPEVAAHKQLLDHLMTRDVSGMLANPAAYKTRIGSSRYRDFTQIWGDMLTKVAALVSTPAPPPPGRELVLYQDRLRDENHGRNDRVAWGIGVLRDESGSNLGAVLVAFDMRATNAAVRSKYFKGLGIVAFFVALIIVQNVISRRDKLRLLDLETRYTSAKTALREAIPHEPLESGPFRITGALDQAKGPVDGMAWSAVVAGHRALVLAVDPDGDGIDAAAVGLHMIKTFRARCDGAFASLDEEVAALGAATNDIPLTRPIGLALLSIDLRSGAFVGRLTAFASLRMLGAPSPATVKLDTVPDGIVGPLSACDGVIPKGASLLVFCAGLGEKEASLEADALARYLERAHGQNEPLPVEDATTWARGRTPALVENDIAVVAISRQAPSKT